MLPRLYWIGVVLVASVVVSIAADIGIVASTLAVSLLAIAVFVPLRSLGPESRRLAWATGTRRWLWVAGGAVFGAGVGLVTLLGDPTYFVDCAVRSTRRCRTSHTWATIAYATGIAAGVIAVSAYPVYRLVRDGRETTAAAVEPGDVIVSGEVVPATETIETPFTGTDAVCYRYAVQERHNTRAFADEGSWHTVAVGERGVPFYVEDETGRVLVSPENAALTLTELTPTTAADEPGGMYPVDASVTVAAADRPPQPVADWEADRGGWFPLRSREKRYTETRLCAGDTVTVAGRATTVTHDYPERLVIGGGGAPTKISAEDQLTGRLTGVVWLCGAIATLLIPIGFVGMVVTL